MFLTHQRRAAASALASLTVSIILVLACSTRANAWGKEGHEIVATIAERYLEAHSPAALARAKQLLGVQSLADVAVFADDVREQRQYTKNWHYVDIPLGQGSYVAARDCRLAGKGDCAVQALIRFGFVLANQSEDRCARAEALRFIIHLIGDMHQPLHNINDNDSGGNGKTVRFFDLIGFDGGKPNLHEVWDSGIILHSGQSVNQFVTALGPQNDPNSIAAIIQPTNPITWVEEAHKLAQDAYHALPHPNNNHIYILDANNNYFNAGLQVVKTQLRRGGLRLGRTLEGRPS
jgi:hypothetical protein